MCLVFTILHRREMGGKDEEEHTSKKLSYRQVRESETRVQDEETKKAGWNIGRGSSREGRQSCLREDKRGEQERGGISMEEKWTRKCN